MNLFPSSWFESKQTKDNRQREKDKKQARRIARILKNKKKSGESSSSLDSSASMNTMLTHLRKSIRNLKSKKDKKEEPAPTQAPAQTQAPSEGPRGSHSSYSSYYSSHDDDRSRRGRRRGRHHTRHRRSSRDSRHDDRRYDDSRGSRYEGSRYDGSRYEGSRYDGSRYEGSRYEGSQDEDYELLSRMDPSDIDGMLAKLTEMKLKVSNLAAVPAVDLKPAQKATDAIAKALDTTTSSSTEKRLTQMLARTEKGQESVLKLQEFTTEFIKHAHLSPEETAAAIEQMQREGAPVALITTLVQQRKKYMEDQAADQRKLELETLAQLKADLLKSEEENAARIAAFEKIKKEKEAAITKIDKDKLKEKEAELKTTVAASTAAVDAAQSNYATAAKIIAGTAAAAGVAYGLYRGVPAAYSAVGTGLGHVGSALGSGALYLGNAGLGLAKTVAITAALKKGKGTLSNWYFGPPPPLTGGRTRRARQKK
jgi:hypothetical protein